MPRTILTALSLAAFLAVPAVAQDNRQEPGPDARPRVERRHGERGLGRFGLGERFRRHVRERIERNPMLRDRLRGRLERRLDHLRENGRHGPFERHLERFDRRLDRRDRLRELLRERWRGERRPI